jgi:hypothetical protein
MGCPIDPSSMTRWRPRLGEAGAEALLKEMIETGLRMKAIKPTQLQRVNVDTTVRRKAVRFPTDARLYNRARARLVKTARDCGLKVEQGYERIASRPLITGIATSKTMTSGRRDAAFSTASRPFRVCITLRWSPIFNNRHRPSRTTAWFSASRTVILLHALTRRPAGKTEVSEWITVSWG